jgi:hypothetical protein
VTFDDLKFDPKRSSISPLAANCDVPFERVVQCSARRVKPAAMRVVYRDGRRVTSARRISHRV